jgi:hypothetical protein
VGRLFGLLQKFLLADLGRIDVDPAKLASNGFNGFTLGFVDEEHGKDAVGQTNTAKDQEYISTHGSLKRGVDETNDKVEELQN